VGLRSIDHVVGNVEEGRLDDWVAWYREVLGFEEMPTAPAGPKAK
jgi:4-hydroxyphenylpyruvate dioxygenase